ncbi:hypothetical protein [Pannonibacter tanglangensis]|nr:hypothetical protein [Pannonibacter sp. XCT-53]
MSDQTAMHQVRAHVEAAVLTRARQDGDFRALLMTEPHAALRELLGNDPIPGLRIRVIEEPAGEVVLVLPRPIEADELPDELLDYAAGGNAKDCWWKFNQWAYKQDWMP